MGAVLPGGEAYIASIVPDCASPSDVHPLNLAKLDSLLSKVEEVHTKPDLNGCFSRKFDFEFLTQI